MVHAYSGCQSPTQKEQTNFAHAHHGGLATSLSPVKHAGLEENLLCDSIGTTFLQRDRNRSEVTFVKTHGTRHPKA